MLVLIVYYSFYCESTCKVHKKDDKLFTFAALVLINKMVLVISVEIFDGICSLAHQSFPLGESYLCYLTQDTLHRDDVMTNYSEYLNSDLNHKITVVHQWVSCVLRVSPFALFQLTDLL